MEAKTPSAGIQQRTKKRCRIIAFQPGRLVDNHRERRGVAFGEGVAAKGAQLLKDRIGDRCWYALRLRAGHKGIVQLLRSLRRRASDPSARRSCSPCLA